MKNLNEKSYSQVLSEANDFFQAQGISIIGDGYREVATNASLFETYVDCLVEGVSADHAATMSQLMTNSNNNILRESSMTGIQPVASLSMPVIRKLWPKFALKDALKTEVPKSPRFVVSYTRPYMQKGDGEKVYLPKGLVNENGTDLTDAGLKNITAKHTVAVKAGSAVVVDFEFDDEGSVDPAVVISNTPSAAKKQPLDRLVILGVNEAPTFKPTASLDINGTAMHDIVIDGAAGQLIVKFAGADRKATLAFICSNTEATATVELYAEVSTEYNEDSYSVYLDVARRDIDIPTGQHINAPLPTEYLNDLMALYQIDGTKTIVDVMTNLFSMKLDYDVLNFIERSFHNQPGFKEFADYAPASEYEVTFDCKPAAGFAGSPKAWREEIKPLIDFVSQKIKNATYLNAGKFTIVGNPIDVQLLANVDWSFRGGQGTNMDGVDVDYSIGTYVGANAYEVIASVNVPAGAMYVIFTPSTETQMTYKYYPYSFSTEMGYTDPNHSRTPSIMMTKRHTFAEFLPAIAKIVVLNNDGKGYFVNHGQWNQA
jgi:hypothetical protein